MARGLGWVLRATWLVAPLLGCASEAPKRTEFRDDGVVCLKLLNDGTVHATVTFRTCLSSCDRALPASCTIAVEGDTLRFTSQGASERIPGDACTDACAPLAATCTTSETVAPGTRAIVHGEDSGSIALGASGECLFRD